VAGMTAPGTIRESGGPGDFVRMFDSKCWARKQGHRPWVEEVRSKVL